MLQSYLLPHDIILYLYVLPERTAPYRLVDFRAATHELLRQISPRGTRWYLKHHTSGAPYLVDASGSPITSYSISISHSGRCVALALASPILTFGIDLQVESFKLEQISSRFLAPSEWLYYQTLLTELKYDLAIEWLRRVWGLKEAAFKAMPPTTPRDLRCNYVVSTPIHSSQQQFYQVLAERSDRSPISLVGWILGEKILEDKSYKLALVYREPPL